MSDEKKAQLFLSAVSRLGGSILEGQEDARDMLILNACGLDDEFKYQVLDADEGGSAPEDGDEGEEEGDEEGDGEGDEEDDGEDEVEGGDGEDDEEDDEGGDDE